MQVTTAMLDRIAGCRDYSALVREFPPRVIRKRSAYAAALRVIERLMSIDAPNRDQLEFLELLSGLVEAYESRGFPTPNVPLKNLLAHLIEAKEASQTEVARSAKISPATLSDVLAGLRGLRIENMKRLGHYFGVDPSVFIVVG
jgi:antitoxin component HigA of HigAB toxin-antitoxin module